jgi:shikimate dehydrogenase
LLEESERSGFAGLNITHPCKQSVIQYLTDLSDDARALGAVNAVVFRNGKRTGHNTDWYGFAESFERGMSGVSIQNVTQLGAGGAGSAVAYAMMKRGVGTLFLFDTDGKKAEGLAETLGRKFDRDRIKVIERITNEIELSDGLINTTPIGMAKYPGTPIPAEFLRPSLWFAEVIYFPLETELLKIARTTGCRTIDGGGMAVFQAVESFRLFTGITPDSDRILKWFRRHFQA